MRTVRAAVVIGSALATLGAGHTVVNACLLRRPDDEPPPTHRRVAVLVPCRDEAPRIPHLLGDLLAQRGVPGMTVTVLDDASCDGTADAATRAGDERVTVLRSDDEPPPGWLGKPTACHRLAAGAPPDAEVLVFVDADVRLAPHAVAAAVDLLERSGLDLVCPWPRQLTGSPAERLVQPLLQWSWLTTVPLRVAERSSRPSLAAANGQFLVVRRAAYEAAGGHAAVAGEVLEDIALLRAVKRSGGRGGPAEGSTLATCRMYTGAAELRAGYAKSLWAAFGSPAGAAGVLGLLSLTYLVPALALLSRRHRLAGLAGYVAGVASRVVAARATGGRALPEALAHPVSVAAFAALTCGSLHGYRSATLAWKGRALPRRQRRVPACNNPSLPSTSRVERDRFSV